MGYLGPPGTFTEEVALHFAGPGTVLQEFTTIDRIVEEVAGGGISRGMVPLENSLEGSVNITLDMLSATGGVYICREVIHPISHTLMTREDVPLARIKEVFSHYQAFAQCRNYLKKNVGEAALIPMESTAAAAARVAAAGGDRAAVAPFRAAGMFGLLSRARDIQDKGDNVTRFVVLARKDHRPTGKDRTSVVIAIKDGPGSLYEVLGIFAGHRINLTRIESRPARRNLGDYLFFIDFEGHRLEPGVERLLSELKTGTVSCKMLGSYPQDTPEQTSE